MLLHPVVEGRSALGVGLGLHRDGATTPPRELFRVLVHRDRLGCGEHRVEWNLHGGEGALLVLLDQQAGFLIPLPGQHVLVGGGFACGVAGGCRAECVDDHARSLGRAGPAGQWRGLRPAGLLLGGSSVAAGSGVFLPGDDLFRGRIEIMVDLCGVALLHPRGILVTWLAPQVGPSVHGRPGQRRTGVSDAVFQLHQVQRGIQCGNTGVIRGATHQQHPLGAGDSHVEQPLAFLSLLGLQLLLENISSLGDIHALLGVADVVERVATRLAFVLGVPAQTGGDALDVMKPFFKLGAWSFGVDEVFAVGQRYRDDVPFQPLGSVDGKQLDGIGFRLHFAGVQASVVLVGGTQVIHQIRRAGASELGELLDDVRELVEVAGANGIIRVAVPAGEHLAADTDHVLDVRDEVRQRLGEAVATQVAELAGELGDGSHPSRAHPLLVGIREVRDGVRQPHGGVRWIGDRFEELFA